MEIKLIEPFPAYYLPLVWEWLAPVKHLVCDDFAPKSRAEYVEYGSRVQRTCRTFGVEIDGRLGGLVIFEALNPATAVGHALFARRTWGTEAPAEALWLACERMYEAGTRKVLALIPDNNRLAIALVTRHGGTVEGILRSHTVKDGAAINAVAVGMTREEYYGLQSRRSSWRQQRNEREHDRRLDHGDERGNDGGQHVEHVHSGSAGATSISPAGDTGDARRELGAGSDGERNAERRPDQPDGSGHGKPGQSVSRVARVRTKRASGTSSTIDGARKTGKPRKQRSELRPNRPPTTGRRTTGRA